MGFEISSHVTVQTNLVKSRMFCGKDERLGESDLKYVFVFLPNTNTNTQNTNTNTQNTNTNTRMRGVSRQNTNTDITTNTHNII